MANIITRKCAKCKGEIKIDVNDICGILKYKDYYYHSKCFRSMAETKATSKKGKPAMWKEALDRFDELEAETKDMLEQRIAVEELEVWLLKNYDITAIPKRIYQIIAELKVGEYKGKKCRPVSARVLCDCWKWGQRKLNEINQYNKSHNKGPTDDNSRLMYDLAILVGKVPNYLACVEKQKAAEIERQREIKENIKVDYSKIANNATQNNNLQDISSLVDDIF